MWRAPLAGLASLAMVATMGVAASTANAASLTNTVSLTTASGTTQVSGIWQNESLAEAKVRSSSALTFTGYPYYADSAYTKPYDVTAAAKNSDAVYQGSASDGRKYVTVTLKLDSKSAQVIDGATVNSQQDIYATAGTIGTTHSVKDAANNYVVNQWVATYSGPNAPQPTTYNSIAEVRVPDTVTHVTVAPKGTPSPASTLRFLPADDWAGKYVHLTGSYIDGGGLAEAYTVDAVKGADVTLPGVSYGTDDVSSYVDSWADGEGNVVSGTTVKADGDKTYTAQSDSNAVVVSFDANGGTLKGASSIRPEADKTIKEPEAPTRDGYTFAGWKVPASGFTADGNVVKTLPDGTQVFATFSGVYFNQSVTLFAQWAQNYDIDVTFHYGNYEGAPADKTETVNANSYIAEPEAPTREGYVFDYWTYDVAGVAKEFNFDTKLAKEGNNGANFTLTAKWHRATTDEAQNALNYVQSTDYVNKDLGVNAGKVNDQRYFTSSTWSAFLGEYKKAYQEYKAARQLAPEIDSKTAADVVNTLTAAWKDLRFTSEYADTTLDGVNNLTSNGERNTSKVVYRLATPSGLQHLLTADENEVWSLTNKYVGQGGWNKDATTFRTINIDPKDKSKWIDGTKANGETNKNEFGDGSGFVPLVKQITRLYNPDAQEHLYTSDQNEIDTLTRDYGWTKDSNLATFYAPAQYTTKTKVVRLYNPSTFKHLYTNDQNEVNVLTGQRGWTKDSDNASFYAL